MKSILPILLFVASTAQAVPPKVKPTIDIKANRMELSQKSGTVNFEGEVVVKQGNLAFHCEHLEARYDKSGQLLELKAKNQVRVSAPEWTAHADTARYKKAEDVLELHGQPRVHRGGHWLEGKVIRIHLKEQRLIIEEARGRFEAPPIPPLAQP